MVPVGRGVGPRGPRPSNGVTKPTHYRDSDLTGSRWVSDLVREVPIVGYRLVGRNQFLFSRPLRSTWNCDLGPLVLR